MCVDTKSVCGHWIWIVNLELNFEWIKSCTFYAAKWWEREKRVELAMWGKDKQLCIQKMLYLSLSRYIYTSYAAKLFDEASILVVKDKRGKNYSRIHLFCNGKIGFWKKSRTKQSQVMWNSVIKDKSDWWSCYDSD